MKILLFLLLVLIPFGSIFSSNELLWSEVSKIGTASSSQKLKLIYFHADWCKWCRKLENEVFVDSEVMDFLNDNFQLYQADIEKGGMVELEKSIKTIREFADYLEVTTFPTIVFLDPNNNLIGNLNGFYDKEKFMEVLKFVYEKR